MSLNIPILEYHDLGHECDGEKTFHSPYVLAPEKFHHHLQWLKDNGYETVSCDDFVAGRVNPKSVIITFDDGHISAYTQALPILQLFEYQATFFLVSRFVGQDNYLNRKHIREMQEAGMRFESHSMTHPYLLTLGRKVMEKEIRESKLEIEQITGDSVHHFCIPYGFYNRELLHCIKDAGYQTAITEKIGYASPKVQSFHILPRFTIKKHITQQDFIHIMCRQYHRMLSFYLFEITLHWAKKILGFNGYMKLKTFITRCIAVSSVS